MNSKLYFQLMSYPILLILLVSFLLSLYHISKYSENFLHLQQNLATWFQHEAYTLSEQKVKDTVLRVEMFQNEVENNLKKRIQLKVDNVVGIMETLYEKNHKKFDEKTMKKVLLEFIESIPFEDKNNFLCVNDLNSSKSLSKGSHLTQSKVEILKNKPNGFQKVYLKKISDQTKEYPKIVYFKKFKPYNWLIATGEYIDNQVKQVQADFLKKITVIENNANSNLSILKVNGALQKRDFEVLLSNSILGKVNSKLDGEILEKSFPKNVLVELEKNGSFYHSYFINHSSTKEKKQRHTYFYYCKEWNWIIGNGVYDDDIQILLEQKRELFKKNFSSNIIDTILISTLVVIIASISFYFLIKEIVILLQNRENEISLLNQNLSKRINKQVEVIREKDMFLVQKSKNEELGEMMAMITHQWRQPLHSINAILANIYIQNESATLDNKKINSYIEQIENLLQFMSTTISSFSSFYTPSSLEEKFDIKEAVDEVLNILFTKYTSSKKPEVIYEIEDSSLLFGLKSNFQQIVLILMNNMIENFEREAIENPRISIKVIEKHKGFILIFEDNGGGIDQMLLDRIFDLYTTTKGGTLRGLGLYMAKLVLKSSFNGTIEASNSKNGAVFTIGIDK